MSDVMSSQPARAFKREDIPDRCTGMERIVIIGCIGAGKSVFSERLSRITGLKLFTLDRLFWDADGKGKDRFQWREIQDEITSGASWIIEGNYGATIDLRLQRADTVIFMDYSPLRCLCGLLRRILTARLHPARRTGIVRGCNERVDLKLLKYAWTFNSKHRKGIIKGAAAYPNVRLITLRRRKEAEAFLQGMKSREMDAPESSSNEA